MTSGRSFFDKLKKRWGIHKTTQVIIILIVFSCTGFSVLYVEDLLFRLMNVPAERGFWMRLLLFVVVTLPVYNILLLIYGFIFGQFRFFWNFEKKFFRRIFRIFRR